MLSPAVVTDLPVLVALIAAWLTVAVFWEHVPTRRRLHLRGARPGLGYGTFIVAASAMAATGLLRWAGTPPQYVRHGGISCLVIGLVAMHLWSVRRALRARIRGGK